MTNDIIVKLINFPTNAREAVTENEDGTYTIFINEKLTHEMQLKAYAHALKHIMGKDFERENVDEIEYYAHNVKTAIDSI